MKRKLLFLLTALLLLTTGNAWATPTIIKTYDFYTASTSADEETTPGYSGTTTINKIGCDNLTGDWAGIAVQGAANWKLNRGGSHSYDGYYNNNGGGRLFAVLDLKEGDIVHITANGGLATSATNATYDSEKSTEGTDCYYTMTTNGNFAVSVTRYFQIRVVTVTRDVADLETPTYEITGANGNERQVTLSCLTEGAVIKYNTTDDKSAAGWTTYSAPFYTAETTLYAYSEKSASTSDVIEITTGAGSAITLNAPTISGTFVANGLIYNPRYSFSSNQSGKVIGEPTLTYTYSFNSGAATEGTTYSPSASGSLTVTVSAEGYTSNSTTQDVFGGNFARTYFFDAINDVSVDTESGTWGNASNIGGAQWTFTSVENCEYTLRGDMSLSGFMYARATTAKTKQGFYTRTSSGLVNFELSAGEAIMFTTLGDNIIANSSNTSQAIGQYTNIRSINIFTPATEVDIAILDCKKYDSSAAFATAIDAESFASAAEVYAFNTSYHITNGVLTDGVRDITGVIRNAQVNDAVATDWAGAGTYQNEQYTGAPDPYFIDNNGANMWATQWIYGLPAGKYKVKVATRGAAANYNHIYISNGTEDIARVEGTHVGNTGGELGNGWSWTYVPFTITETTNLIFGFYKNATNWAGCDDWHLYRVESVTATIGSTGWTTFASTYPLDLSNMTASTGEVKAYYASASGENTVTMTSTESTGVAAGEGLMLKGSAGATVTIPVAASGSAIAGNLLVGCTTLTEGVSGAKKYVLVNNGGTAEFQNLGTNSANIPAGKAYLDVTSASARLAIILDEGDATGINAVEAADEETEGLKDGKYLIDGKIVIVNNGVKYSANGQKLN